MKKIDVGQTIGILANLGVVAGILFLVVEIQQNTEMATKRSPVRCRRARCAVTMSANVMDNQYCNELCIVS